MKKLFYSLLFIGSSVAMLTSCSSGDYVANPASNANGSINPLHPLKAEDFTWATNGSKLSMNINGAPWSTDTVYLAWVDSLQTNIVSGYANGRLVQFYIKEGWAGNVYNMGYKQYDYRAIFLDGVTTAANGFQSVAGNSGELYMTKNDTVNFCGKFYFQGVDPKNNVCNITNGVFTLTK